jgi:Uma2 family endonuclease
MPTTFADAPALMTSEKLFKMRPNKTLDRWIYRGELREEKMSLRGPNHANTCHNVNTLLGIWIRSIPKPRGKVFCGDAYFRIRQDPESNVGLDIALSTIEQAESFRKKLKYIDGPPLLAIEVLSPSDKQADIYEKLEEYLDCGTPAVWIVDPLLETVQIHRRGRDPEILTRSERIENQPELPGFTCTVAEFFE